MLSPIEKARVATLLLFPSFNIVGLEIIIINKIHLKKQEILAYIKLIIFFLFFFLFFFK